MIKEEAYQKMSEGYMVTHKLFNPNEYLYMDDCFIIRSQDGEVFENDWDVRTSPEWNIDWYIYKGKFNKPGRNIPEMVKKQRVNMSALPMYEMQTGKEDKIPELMDKIDFGDSDDPPIWSSNNSITQNYDEVDNELPQKNDLPKSRVKRLLLKILYFFIRRIE